jgi:rhamnose utilization protein RhaD (predicted bifunctional aldolase and dehydrogenase)/NAD(P)-dependent dehydrogenase (short-subunit alcohol dehydrogenase family)
MPELQAMPQLEDLWDEQYARSLPNQLTLLRYRSNVLGADLRITNFGGGNTSSKFDLTDPFTGDSVRVLGVKGSGGDLGSITDSGFAILRLDCLEKLKSVYRGEAYEDEMVRYYPLAAFADGKVAPSIDTPLHALLPFPHIDHLHPDWAIALATSANGKNKLDQFNRQHGRKMLWVPWQRPGFELALMLEKAVRDDPATDGILLGGHGLFTWGTTQRECYLNTLRTINAIGEFILEHKRRKATIFGGVEIQPSPNRKNIAAKILPCLRGLVSSQRRVIGHYRDDTEATTFAGSKWAGDLSELGTSCPDHFLRTRVFPMFVPWNPEKEDTTELKCSIQVAVEKYRIDYQKYYNAYATSDSPRLRDPNPSVVVIPGLGLFGFGKNKKEARIATEFFINAIRVMEGATALEDGAPPVDLPQAKTAAQSKEYKHFHNYVALARSEAFRIEYWALEEAKLQRMPAEGEFSRKIALVVGGASGIGREAALLLAKKGAHVVVSDADHEGAKETAVAATVEASPEQVAHTRVDITSSESLCDAIQFTTLTFGGVDAIVNTAGIYALPGPDDNLNETQWSKSFLVNVAGNYLLAQETQSLLTEQGLPAAMVLTSSANAVVPKAGSEAYDTSKAALSHLIRELAIKLGPLVRVNGIAPATVVTGSAMFPRDRVIQSLEKYKIEFSPDESTDELRSKLAEFYAQRTITKCPIAAKDCANAILWLLSEQSAKTTGHIIPIDGGLPEAFLR